MRAIKRTSAIALMASAALLIPPSQAGAGEAVASADDGPAAVKSGAIINWQSGFKLRVSRRI